MAETPVPPALSDLIQELRWEGMERDERFQLYLENRDGLLYLVVEGRVLQAVPQALSALLRRILEAMPQARVVIDLRRCDYLASPFLGFLVEFRKLSIAAAARTVMLMPNEPLRSVLDLLEISRLFTLVASEREACDRLQADMDSGVTPDPDVGQRLHAGPGTPV